MNDKQANPDAYVNDLPASTTTDHQEPEKQEQLNSTMPDSEQAQIEAVHLTEVGNQLTSARMEIARVEDDAEKRKKSKHQDQVTEDVHKMKQKAFKTRVEASRMSVEVDRKMGEEANATHVEVKDMYLEAKEWCAESEAMYKEADKWHTESSKLHKESMAAYEEANKWHAESKAMYKEASKWYTEAMAMYDEADRMLVENRQGRESDIVRD